jgi:hypothetical protein
MEAARPLLDLLGTSPKNFFRLAWDANEVSLVVPVRHEDDPQGRAPSQPAGKTVVGLPAHPQGLADSPIVVGDGAHAELAYDVKVEVID